MTVSIEAYRCAVGQLVSIFVKLLLKKATRKARKVYDSEVFKGEVCSGTDIAVFSRGLYCQQCFSSVRRFVFI